MLVKHWYESKTLGLAVISILIFAGTLISQNAGVLNLSASTVAWIGIVLSVVVAILRLVTNTAILGTPAADLGVPQIH